ncbi:MAG TPA: mycofactocin-coupled SDR family oxidoreductase [Nocardioides sp.]|uniref:mycofactocin-coupled SDR family oxidoreductase n=1 Tax=uncultured Nocardioides sp. TaxID=198441 RepID=UPI000ED23BAF|nr:mycofactocin-coupled SDR family oxidoreductase [uncultured Nocardioides sp.]HCB06228.1 SDR family mycofactocin-dependent oxidoreductase [Nocardioides sp.]HRD59611.1 mycofactocin-coupled SDR family oxidoreductase [Nocardioides sp.]HRI94232.1 mycofactocin-coupled SDR family oxidoreductase [Nocardioides sp.]HRK44315.1 mycofactocin-coupled SDR family oxidoreductase [Nocardioides sp.]
MSKVALITGAARGQGRSHAVRLARDGFDIVAVDLCAALETPKYAGASRADLDETEELVRAAGARIVTVVGDVRSSADMQRAVRDGVEVLGRLDVVVANAGIVSSAPLLEMTELQWREVVDINLTGVWRSVQAALPQLIEQGSGGSIVLISSIAGMRGFRNLTNYTAAKHGLGGLAAGLANELAEFGIRVNVVAPTNVPTDMILNPSAYRTFRPDLEAPTLEEAMSGFASINLLDTPWVSPEDISGAVAFLASDRSRFITGTTLPVDAGVFVRT